MNVAPSLTLEEESTHYFCRIRSFEEAQWKKKQNQHILELTLETIKKTGYRQASELGPNCVASFPNGESRPVHADLAHISFFVWHKASGTERAKTITVGASRCFSTGRYRYYVPYWPERPRFIDQAQEKVSRRHVGVSTTPTSPHGSWNTNAMQKLEIIHATGAMCTLVRHTLLFILVAKLNVSTAVCCCCNRYDSILLARPRKHFLLATFFTIVQLRLGTRRVLSWDSCYSLIVVTWGSLKTSLSLYHYLHVIFSWNPEHILWNQVVCFTQPLRVYLFH